MSWPRRSLPLCALIASSLACSRAPARGSWHDTLRVAVPFDVTTLDPHALARLDHYAMLANVFEPLVANDPDLRLRPALADHWETPDGDTWIFHLRPARFASGQQLTSADVAWTIERVRKHPELQIRGAVTDVVEVSAPDPSTLVLRTAGRSRTLLSRLANVYVLRKGTTDAELQRGAEGTGPYTIEAWQAGRFLRLLRRDDAPSELPLRVEFALARAADKAASDLATGLYDLVRADVRGLETRLPPGFRVLRRENLFTKMLAFDHARERTPFADTPKNPFRDLRVRRALHLGLDRQALVERLTRQAQPNVQPVPRSVFGFDPNLPKASADVPAARALLAAAGYSAGFRVTLHTRAVHAEDARLVASALVPLGIQADVVVPPDAEYFALLASGGASFWLDRFGCTTGDAAELLESLMHSRDATGRYGTFNFGGFSDPDVDRLTEEIAVIEDGAASRRDRLQSAMALLVERLPVVSLFNDEDVYGMTGALTMRPRADSLLPLADLGLADSTPP